MRKLILPLVIMLAFPALDAKGNELDISGVTITQTNTPGLPPVTKAVFENGLKLLILENHTSPTVSFFTCFRAGSIDNISGQSGLAHLLEHMAFKGTKTLGTNNYKAEKSLLDKMDAIAAQLNEETVKPVPDNAKITTLKNELAALQKEAGQYVVQNEMPKTYTELGANDLNAFTSNDVTAYKVSLPSNHVEDWMIIESDRFKNPVFREFYKERDVVHEELRMGKSDPFRVVYYALNASAFSASPYHTPVIGWEDDVARLLRPQAEEYFRTYYGPNNATMAIVGDVTPGQVIRLVKKYFRELQARPLPDRTLTKEPEHKGERRAAVKLQASPLLVIGFNTPNQYHEDAPALAVIDSILSYGMTSRFYKNLVEGKQVALYAGSAAFEPGMRENGLFMVYCAPKAPHTAADVEKAIYEELEKMKTSDASENDIAKAVNHMEAEMVKALEDNADMSQTLAYYDSITGDWQFAWNFIRKLKTVTPQDIKRVAAKYFTQDNRSVVWLENTDAAKEAK
ncbi:MAG: pitrilysin family protein [Elusimicrobiaceae bacterium]|jgi:predicted Zn-dependent peptidase